MSVLDQFTLTQKTRTMQQSPEAKLRGRLIEGLHEQIKAAQAYLAGEAFKRFGERWVMNEETEVKELQTVRLRFTPWFWTELDGKAFVGIRYGNRWLEIKPKKTTIELASIEELVPTLTAILEAVNAGELDGVLQKAADARKAQFARRKTKAAA